MASTVISGVRQRVRAAFQRSHRVSSHGTAISPPFERLNRRCISTSSPTPVLIQSARQSAFSQPPAADPLGSALLDLVTYEAVCNDTLDSLCEHFDMLVERSPHLKHADITFSDGVLTINFGGQHGTYVINRQSPNRQIWLSSPTSGPKRYDFVPSSMDTSIATSATGRWVYKHDGVTLHELLQREIAVIVRGQVDFINLPFGGDADQANGN